MLGGIVAGVPDMTAVMQGNRFNVRPGDPAFSIFTNLTDYFQFGVPTGADMWLEGQIVDGEFVFNGRLFMHDGTSGVLIDSFPKGPAPAGWTQRRRLQQEGYELLDSRGEVLFSYYVEDKTCYIDIDLYNADGSAAVHQGQGGLVCHVRAQIGRNGICIG